MRNRQNRLGTLMLAAVAYYGVNEPRTRGGRVSEPQAAPEAESNGATLAGVEADPNWWTDERKAQARRIEDLLVDLSVKQPNGKTRQAVADDLADALGLPEDHVIRRADWSIKTDPMELREGGKIFIREHVPGGLAGLATMAVFGPDKGVSLTAVRRAIKGARA